MIYAEFYNLTASGLQPACGDRSVIILDGRNSPSTNGQIAAAECARRGYAAWRIFKGETFNRSSPVSSLQYLSTSKPVSNPVWLSAYNL